MKYLALYLLFINIIAIILCLVDKLKAKVGSWRISEKTLFVTSLMGGALGMFTAMQLIRHKTRHKRFMIGLPIIMFVQAAVMVCFLYRYG